MEVSLEPFTGEHIAATFGWIKDPEFRRLFLMRGNPEWKEHLSYFDKTLKDSSQAVFAIKADNIHIGNCGLKNISNLDKKAELWIYIGESSMRMKGIGGKALRLLINKAFKEFSLKKIVVHVADFNVGAIKMYEKAGFHRVRLSPEDIDTWSDSGCDILKMALWVG